MSYSFERYVRTSRVFILGAGLSAAAGVPLTAELLHKTMRKFAAECPGIFARVDGCAQESIGDINADVDYSKISFSDLCTFLEFIELREYGGMKRWSNAGCREKLALRFYLAKTLAEHTPPPERVPELYLRFAEQLHNRDVVLSFNWDGLLEVALQRLGKPYTYNFEKGRIKLAKLHGSLNWRLGEPHRLSKPVNTLSWEPLGFANGVVERDIFSTPWLLQFDRWALYSPLGEVEPFLVLPGYGKAYDVRSNAALWYKPEMAFAVTHDVFIIGLSLAPDDFFIRSYFLSNLPYIDGYSGVEGRRIYIVNPDPQAPTNYDFVLSKGSADLLREPFCLDHVSLMKNKLAGG